MPAERTARRIEKSGTQKTVRAIDRAIAVLACFDEEHHELTLQEISLKSALHKATALRIVATLLRNGLIHQNPQTGSYSLGYIALRVADSVLHHNLLWQRAKPIMRLANSEVGESVVLSCRIGERLVHLEQTEGLHTINEQLHIGVPLILHATPAGIAMLGSYSESNIEAYLGLFEMSGDEKAICQNLTTKARLAYRASGCVTFVAGELGENAAFAIGLSLNEETLGALSFSVPDSRMSRDLSQRCLRFLMKAKKEIERTA